MNRELCIEQNEVKIIFLSHYNGNIGQGYRLLKQRLISFQQFLMVMLRSMLRAKISKILFKKLILEPI